MRAAIAEDRFDAWAKETKARLAANAKSAAKDA
jgi:hypothetical protein